MNSLVLVLTALQAVVSAAKSSPNAAVGQHVNTTSGVIIGHANSHYPFVSEYLGVPFADPPIGGLRFEPPQACTHKTDVIIADKQPPSCPQSPATANFSDPPDWINYSLAKGAFANHTSEDCLYLNIWAKHPVQGAPLKPVFVWIYGGGFHGGGVGDDSEQGAIFAEDHDVVAVSFNYRLGLLGFPGGPTLRQNLALLDQRLALEWVRDNIEMFGGDPQKIVLAGHSAGGAIADYYNFAWKDDPIISGSIMMSGSAITFGNRYANTSARAWDLAASFAGCGNASTKNEGDIVTCMRTKNTTELLRATAEAEKALLPELSRESAALLGITGPFGPTIDNLTVFENYTRLANDRNFIQRPILTGSNDDEGCYFAMTGQIPDRDEDLLTEFIFTCPLYHTAQGRVDAGIPTWKYRNFGAWPNTYASACPGRPWHGLEVYELFNSTASASKFANTFKEVEAEWYLREAFMRFVHDPEKGPASQKEWPSLNQNPSKVMILGLNKTVATVQPAAVWDKLCQTVLAKVTAKNDQLGVKLKIVALTRRRE